MTSKESSDAAEILRLRARALALAPEPPPAADTMIELLEFRLAQERYAVEIEYVREVYPLKDLTPLPCAPAFVSGIVNVRGHVLPVIDLKKFFDLPDQGLTDLHRIISVHGSGLDLGLLADVVVRVGAVAPNSLQASLPTLTGIRAEYLKGVTADRLIVLDLARVLADSKIIIHEEIDT